MNWSTERDALIAQRLAFIQSVAGAMPGASEKIVPTRPDSTAFPEPASPAPTTIGPAPTNNPSDNSVQSGQARALNPERTLPRSEIRKEFQSRIAAFQAHQHRFHRERDAYFTSVLTKVRSAIETGDKVRPS
jgi:hypothetical protein